MSKQEYNFDNIEMMERKPEIEGTVGTVVDFPGERWMRLLAASDANPKWKAQSDQISIELRRLNNAMASNQRVRDYLSRKFAECCITEWGGWKIDGVEIPLSVEASTALLRRAQDAYDIVYGVVWETKNFRGQRLEAVVEETKN
jgi:hypothetical protein